MDNYILLLSSNEFQLLNGLPYLSQLTYFHLIYRANNKTFKVGDTNYRISYQALREWLYIEPKQGLTKAGSPSLSQLRTALLHLIQAGLVIRQSISQPRQKQLILSLPYRKQTFQSLNKLSMFTTKEVSLFVSEGEGSKKAYNSNDSSDLDLLSIKNIDRVRLKNHDIPQNNINKKKKKNVSVAMSKIKHDFYPTTDLVSRAQASGYDKVTCEHEIQKFINYHLVHGTEADDWQAKYFGWLIYGKKSNRQLTNKKRRIYSNEGKRSTCKLSEIEKVQLANGYSFDGDVIEYEID